MNVFRFLTKRDIELSMIQLLFIIVGITGTIVFLDTYRDEKRESAKEARQSASEARQSKALADARAEIRRLKAGETKRDGTPRSTSASLKGSSETETQTPTVHAHDRSDVSTSDDTVEIVHTGPLKGLPLDLAKEIHKEYTAASIARARRYHEWYQRWQAHREKGIALGKKEVAYGDAVLAHSKQRREQLYAIFALMSPEQLEAERKAALKTQSAEDVDLFFRRLEAFGAAKTPEQIEQDAQSLQENKEVLARESQKLKVEREQLNREREELNRAKVSSPNIDLEEFYTEWKERNRTEPSP